MPLKPPYRDLERLGYTEALNVIEKILVKIVDQKRGTRASKTEWVDTKNVHTLLRLRHAGFPTISHMAEVCSEFDVFSVTNGEWVPFEKGFNYDSFLIKKRIGNFKTYEKETKSQISGQQKRVTLPVHDRRMLDSPFFQAKMKKGKEMLAKTGLPKFE